MKLGYGGTKEEMERLLADAEKLSGIEYDISSYADIVDAIHTIQGEMEISGRTAEEAAAIYERTGREVNEQLGTTAKEASTTIQGSVATAKSAWENLVVGIADENADLDALIGNFVESVGTAGENIIPRVEQILTGIGDAIQTFAPIISEQVPGIITAVLPSMIGAGAKLLVGLTTGLVSALPGLVSAAPDIIDSFVTAIQDNLLDILAAGGELLNMFKTGIIDRIPEMIQSLPEIIDGILNFITEKLPLFLEKGGELLEKFAFGILEYIPQLVAQLPAIISSITEFITTNFPVILEKGGELLGKLLAGILGAIPEIAVQLPAVIEAIVEQLKAGWEMLKEAGSYLLEGLWNGISDKIGWLKGKVTGVVDTIKGWFTGSEGFDEHSPSKWANQVFRYVMEGGGEGLEAGMPALMQDIDSVVNRVKNGMDFGTANVDFSASGIGQSSAAIINSATNGEGGGLPVIQLAINLLTGDARPFAEWILPDLIQAANAAGTPISSGQYA